MSDDIIELVQKVTEPHREVLRLRTTAWQDERGGIHIRKDLIPMRKKSFGFQLLQEEAPMVGVDLMVDRIVNLNKLPDGLYVSAICNESRDWETGTVDDYDYKLVPFTEAET